MNTKCSIGHEQDGLTRLNLCQHSLYTIISILQHGDQLIIIKFNQEAFCVFNKVIDNTNKLNAKETVDALYAYDGTYIWSGLEMAYRNALNSINENIHILLLTDGQTMGNPVDQLKTYFDSLSPRNSEFLKKIKLTTFGFSSDINSKMLFELADLTGSYFNFIPDASMLGTAFCNYIAFILCSDLSICHIKQIDEISIDQNTIISSNLIDTSLLYELIRFHCYEVLKDVCNMTDTNRLLNNNMIDLIEQFKCWIQIQLTNNQNLNDPLFLDLMQNLLKDFISDNEHHEQITKALSRNDWFYNWGYHYLLALALAHKYRVCHNYKDQGVQLYITPQFQQYQDDAYELFRTIKPPKTILNANVHISSMSAYVNNSGGCFDPKCQIKLIDGTFMSLDELTGNELIYQGDGVDGAIIKYIVKTSINKGIKSMCQFDNGLIISPYHPFFDNTTNTWIFPIQLTQPVDISMNYMYNIVLESGYWIEINGIKCVSLGHQLELFDETNKILDHDYFGTTKVIDDLEMFETDENNTKIINVHNYTVLRDAKTKLVCGILQNLIM